MPKLTDFWFLCFLCFCIPYLFALKPFLHHLFKTVTSYRRPKHSYLDLYNVKGGKKPKKNQLLDLRKRSGLFNPVQKT